MTTVNVTEQSNTAKYLIITQQKDPSTLITTRVVITDNLTNRVRLVDVQRGPEGPPGPIGPQGPPGNDGVIFDILPIVSGGTNNTVFTPDKIIYYDGNKLSSTEYSIQEIIANNSNQTITGIIEGTGISKLLSGASVTLSANLGSGLSVNSNNQIVIDDSIARRSDLTTDNLSGILKITKGGTNNNAFSTNRLVYFDGNKLASFPLDTGRIVTSGSTISIVAGSGLIGGGSLSIPSGSVVLNIGQSNDILVSENVIELSNTGIAGTYTKVVTDIKGRVISGLSLSNSDIISALGYTPWHAGNDGTGSNLDADLLDGQHGSYYLNFDNFNGLIKDSFLPDIVSGGTYSKVTVSNKGLILNGSNVNHADIVNALGYRPVNSNGDTIFGNLNINGKLALGDNLPVFSKTSSPLLPNEPRGFSFVYGNTFKQTGILAYYPIDNQLKLVTKIFGSGTNDLGGGDSTDLFNGEIDGGDANTVFLLGNLQGDQAIVLLQHMADSRYMRTTTNQIISGIKTFSNEIYVNNRINITNTNNNSDFPINVGDNTNINVNLNSDLLDSEHGSFYRDAANLTGILDYNTVTVSNLDGVVNYIAKFDNRTNNPSRTVSQSIIRQSGSSNIIIENGSLSVGNNNRITQTRSAAIGSDNSVTSQNSLAVGLSNNAKANNSVALNQGCTTNSINSVAMGKNGTTWLPNQLSIGAFEEVNPINNTTRIGLGQNSITSIGYFGTAPSYVSLSPNISIPNNKTLLCNIELLFTKFAGTGAAAFSFESGIIKNYNGVTTILNPSTKHEIYNDSQIKNYLYGFELSPNQKTQTLSVKRPPLQNNPLSIQNLNNVYRIRPNLSEISGYYYGTFDGPISIRMNKPVSSGSFTQTDDSSLIYIKSTDHNMVSGCIADIKFTSGVTGPLPLHTGYVVDHVINQNEFAVQSTQSINNSGYVNIIKKRNYYGTYTRLQTQFSAYQCRYTQPPFSSQDGFRTINLSILDTSSVNFLENYDPYLIFLTSNSINPPNSNYNIVSYDIGNKELVVRISDQGFSATTVTGLANLYTNYGVSNINLSGMLGNANIEANEIIYVDFLSPLSSKPISKNYTTDTAGFNSTTTRSYHLMPDSGTEITGSFYLTIDRDHGFLPPSEKPNLLQQIPLFFAMPNSFTLNTIEDPITPGTPYVGFNNINRLPKSGLFTISDISGHSIYTNSYSTSLFKESSSFYYKDTYTSSTYIRNTESGIDISFQDKQYFQKNDMIYCSFPDSSQYNQNFRITDVLITNDNRKYRAFPLTPVSMPLSGSISFIGATSGFVNSPINNIYFHSYGGLTESWGRDAEGKYVNPPYTGFFSIYNSAKLCNSGTVCIHISGTGSFFENIKIGDKYYFDFIDATGFELKNIFSIHDKLSSDIFTLNVSKFNISNENEKGMVYIIDGIENIKTNKNPNYNNIFINSDVTASNNIYTHTLSTFNDDTNRWKHCLTIPNAIQPGNYTTSFTVTTGSESVRSSVDDDTNVLVLQPDPMEVVIQASKNDGPFINVGNNLSVSADSSLKLKIIVKNGAGKWSTDNNRCAPRINIIGIAGYSILENKNYNDILSQWEILINCGTIKNIYREYSNITVIISDESGRVIKNFTLTVGNTELSATPPQNIIYGYVDNSNLNWELIFETYGGNLNSEIAPTISLSTGFPTNSNSYLISSTNNYPTNWYTIKVFGSPGSITGIYKPVMIVSDGTNSISVTGSLNITQNNPSQEYAIAPRKLNSSINLPSNNLQFRNFGFILPVLDTSSANDFSVEFLNSNGLSITNIEYAPYHDLNLMSYSATISGQPGLYTPQLRIKTKQQSIAAGAQIIEYTWSTGLNVVISNNIVINLDGLIEPIIFDSTKLWELNFSINTPDPNAQVRIGNTPNIGLYNNNSPHLEYNIVKNSNGPNNWRVSVTGKPDIFGETVYRTGDFDLYIYAEDSVSSTTGIAKLRIINNPYLTNIDLNKYSTPNNAFESNVDIGGLSYGSSPYINFKSNISSDGAITPYSTIYSKYDSDIKIWESCFKFEPVTEKWDAQLSVFDNTLLVRAKGITDDKLYIAGKVSTVETDNLNTLLKPLAIKDLQPKQEYKEGESWEISFKTEGGLESPLYPPQISFSGIVPTPCSGYDSLSPVPACVVGQGPNWDNDNKEWKYIFSGVPICTVQEFPLTVIAVDKISNKIVGDPVSSGTNIIYKSLGSQPPPEIQELKDNGLYPNCQDYNSDIVFYGPRIRKTCPVPTGISGIITSGSLPPGIIFVNQTTNFSPPYSNLGSGSFYFTGKATTFAGGAGSTYPQKFNITVVDARGLTDSKDIEFTDLSLAVEPSPTDITIYFANSGYQYTPKRISSADPPVQYPSGTLIIDNIATKLLRPPAASASMECLSILPHNKCLVSDGQFDIQSANTLRLTGSGTSNSAIDNKKINNNNPVYIEFSDYPQFNKVYVAQKTNPLSDFIDITGNHFSSLTPGTTGLVKILNITNNIKNITVDDAFEAYNGNPFMIVDSATTGGILGDGKFAPDPVSQKQGFMGRIRPTLRASLASGVYRQNSEHLEDFLIESLYPEDGDLQHIHAIKRSNCYETAYLRVSGLLLPTFSIDTSDPPPEQDKFYTFIGSNNIAVSIRPAYGNSNDERNNNLNVRQINNPGIQCLVTNMITNAISVSGIRTTTDDNGVITAVFVIPNTLFALTTIGTVFKLSFNYESPYVFPTYDKNALSSAYNEYYWVHRGEENSFPPVVPVTKNNLRFFNDVVNNIPIKFVGGYIGDTPETSLYVSHPPKVTGYLQYIDPIVASGSYTQNSNSSSVVIAVSGHPFSIGDAVSIVFSPSEGSEPLSVSSTSEIISQMNESTITIPSMLSSPNPKNGFAIIKDLVKVESNPLEPNEVIITHRPGITARLPLDNSIDLIKYSDSIYKASVMSNIFPSQNYLLKTISRTSSGTIAAIDRNIALDSNDYYSNITGLCELRQNILLPGDTPSLSFQIPHSSIEPRGESIFSITGVPSVTGSYNFCIITSENPSLTSPIGIQKYIKDYSVDILKSISIVASSNCVQLIGSQNWTYTFSVVGGRYPRSIYPFEIEVDHKIHTFTTSISVVDENTASVTISSKSMGGTYWSDLFQQKGSLKLKVYDDSSSDSILITRCV